MIIHSLYYIMIIHSLEKIEASRRNYSIQIKIYKYSTIYMYREGNG